MNGRVASTMVEIATIPELPEVEIGTVAVTLPVKAAKFEKRRWPYLLALPVMWLLTVYVMAKKATYKLLGKPGPDINTFWFDGLGLSARKVKNGAMSWRALEAIYNHRFGTSWTNIIDDFWLAEINAQAVRNRFKLVKQEVRRAILRFSNHEEVRLISLACGSTRAIIEVMAELKTKGIVVRAILVDIDQGALDYAKGLAKQNGVCGQIETYKTTVSQVVELSRDFKPQVIEMLGFLDYLPKEKAIRLAIKIWESLESKGIFITCNIAPNLDMHFLKWVVNWPMIYRTAGELVEIATEAGFSDCRLIYEPLKIHGLLIAQKD